MSVTPARRICAAARRAGLGFVCLLAACAPEMASTSDSPAYAEPPPVGVEGARIVPIPPIPLALRGCWEWIPNEDPDEPGSPHRLFITATTVEEVLEGSGERVATAEFVESVTPTSIEGLFSAPEGENRATVATALSLGDGGPAGKLRRAEGDAGSDYYTRCAR
jgi:hypothetical protein